MGETEEACRAPTLQGAQQQACGHAWWEEGPKGQHGKQARSETAGAHQQGGPASSQVRVPDPAAQEGMATMAGRPKDQPYFVARGVGTGRKRMTKHLGEAGPWVV